MKKTLFHILCFALMVLVLAGCGSSSAPQTKLSTSAPQTKLSTPRAAWNEFIAALKTEDVQRYFNLLSSRFTESGMTIENARANMEGWKSIGITPDMYDKIAVIQINEQGDHAEVEYQIQGLENSRAKTVFIKEDGEWKLYE